MNNLPENFKAFLISQKSSPATVKNYLADVRQFFSWFYQKTGIRVEVAGWRTFGLFTPETIKEYQQELLTAKVSPSTINRHLSALRKLGRFALSQGWLKENPAEKIPNVTRQKTPSRWPNGLLEGGAPRGWQAGSQAESREEAMTPPRWNREIVLEKFQKHLKAENISPLTIKNYLSDLRHFLGWLQSV